LQLKTRIKILNLELYAHKIIRASRVSQGTRLARLIRHPIKTLLPFAMRKLSLKRSVDLDTAWGGRFSGVLPEAVTSEIWRSGGFELPVSMALLSFLKPGGTYIDVGAHFGYFSLLASKLVGAEGRVLSIEAMPSTYKYLSANIKKNASYQNITAFEGAAYSERAELTFRDFGVVASSLNSAFAARDTSNLIGNPGNEVKVQAHTVDSLVKKFEFKNIDLVKIDAESSEKFVLEGMQETLKEYRPFIVMEVGDSNPLENSVGELLAQMSVAGYSAYYRDQNQRLQQFQHIGNVAYANLVFCPIERALIE
jgi:FkbM family methyltransferase